MQRNIVYICLAAGLSIGAVGAARAEPVALSADQAGVNVNAAVDGSSPLTAGSIVKDGAGATVGRIERVIDVPGGADRVVLRIGSELLSVPASSVDASGKFATTAQSKAQLRALSRAAGG
ncbi:MAG TPA: hypothetical protein VIO94_14795 [Phenylobacterium sp.]